MTRIANTLRLDDSIFGERYAAEIAVFPSSVPVGSVLLKKALRKNGEGGTVTQRLPTLRPLCRGGIVYLHSTPVVQENERNLTPFHPRTYATSPAPI